jgi:anti-sigma regulatory factor (Ser/Thr protein kinase)
VEHRLDHDESAVSVARGLAVEFVAGQLPALRLEDFILMVSEVVTNAVRHAPPEPDGRIALRLEADDRMVRATVLDGGSEFSFNRATFDNAGPDYHFGLAIVDTLADRWGLSLDGRKAVWFEIAR